MPEWLAESWDTQGLVSIAVCNPSKCFSLTVSDKLMMYDLCFLHVRMIIINNSCHQLANKDNLTQTCQLLVSPKPLNCNVKLIDLSSNVI